MTPPEPVRTTIATTPAPDQRQKNGKAKHIAVAQPDAFTGPELDQALEALAGDDITAQAAALDLLGAAIETENATPEAKALRARTAAHAAADALRALGPKPSRAKLAEALKNARKAHAPVVAEATPPPPPDEGLVLGGRPFTAEELTAPVPPVDWISKDLQWCKGRPAFVYGYSESGKSIVVLAAAVALAAGRSIWGMLRTTQRRVLVLVKDSGRDALLERVQRLARGLEGGPVDVAKLVTDGWLTVVPHPAVPYTHEHADALYRKTLAGYDVVLMDAMRGFLPGVDENSSGIRDYLDPLILWSDATGCAIVLLHHEGKPGQGKNGQKEPRADEDAFRGSAGIRDVAGSMHRLAREARPGTEGRDFVLRVAMTKPAERPPSGRRPEQHYLEIEDVEIDDGSRAGLRVVYRTKEQIHPPDPALCPICEALRIAHAGDPKTGAPWRNLTSLAKALGGNKQEALRIARALREQGFVGQADPICLTEEGRAHYAQHQGHSL